MGKDERQLDDELSACPTALGECPKCARKIVDRSAWDVGHWDGDPGGVLYRVARSVCSVRLLAFATGDEEYDMEIEWIAIDP
jgi:hypothetical protein